MTRRSTRGLAANFLAANTVAANIVAANLVVLLWFGCFSAGSLAGEKAGAGKPSPAKPAAGKPAAVKPAPPQSAAQKSVPAKSVPAKAVPAKEAEITPLTDADFQKAISSGVHVVYFWATWCGPCRIQGPIMEQVAKQYAGRVKVHKMDVDAEEYTATKYEIDAVPTSIVFKDGKGIIKLVGVSELKEFAEELDPLLPSSPQPLSHPVSQK